MDATLERLETDLLSRWGREELTVYADYLQSIGDPRGEVVAIDLVNLDKVDPTDWRTQREMAITRWVGKDLAGYLGNLLFQGFIQESSDERLLASPAGEFVRAARIGSDALAFERIASRPRPWLTHLAITDPAPKQRLTNAVVDNLIAATPRLDALVLRGPSLIDRFAHPTVRHVHLEGTDVAALGTLGWSGAWLSPPTQFAIERVREQSPTADSRLYLRASADWANVLRETVIQNHVTHLRIGAGPLAPALLDHAIARLPRLAVIEVATLGGDPDALRAVLAKRHPRLTVV